MELKEFFERHPRTALAFSGGADSAYLLYAAEQYGEEVQAYYVRSEFQPQFELADAKRLAEELSVKLTVLPMEILTDEAVTCNGKDRCYHCKRRIFGAIADAAAKDGFSVLLDGTNASDEEGDRPGMRALRELEVLSPLRECGLTKEEVRRRSREAGLFTWNKPAYACLATRIPTGEPITRDKLQATEKAEDYLASLGFSDFRVRLCGGAARLQLTEGELERALLHREEIVRELKQYYLVVFLDMEVRA